jgi:hypothetical protein
LPEQRLSDLSLAQAARFGTSSTCRTSGGPVRLITTARDPVCMRSTLSQRKEAVNRAARDESGSRATWRSCAIALCRTCLRSSIRRSCRHGPVSAGKVRGNPLRSSESMRRDDIHPSGSRRACFETTRPHAGGRWCRAIVDDEGVVCAAGTLCQRRLRTDPGSGC